MYDEAWDETVEELVSTPSTGEQCDTLKECEYENRDSPRFSHFGDQFKL